MVMQNRCLRIAKVLCLGLLLVRPVCAAPDFDPLTIFVSMVAGKIFNIVVDYGLSISKSEKEYQESHNFLKNQSKQYFLSTVRYGLQESGNEAILLLHEWYRYPAFIAAIKELCPDYAEYIKKIMGELSMNHEFYTVRGFERISTTVRDKESLLSFTTYYTYPFYELIKNLYGEVIALELKEYEAKHEPFKNQTKEFFLAYVTQQIQKFGAEAVLSEHELYLYPDFLAALLELCPGCAEYIKKIISEFFENPDLFKIRGFEPQFRFEQQKDNVLVFNVYTTYPFYELLKQLYQQIVAVEKTHVQENVPNVLEQEVDLIVQELELAVDGVACSIDVEK